jgi:hypothetical protein
LAYDGPTVLVINDYLAIDPAPYPFSYETRWSGTEPLPRAAYEIELVAPHKEAGKPSRSVAKIDLIGPWTKTEPCFNLRHVHAGRVGVISGVERYRSLRDGSAWQKQ